MTSVMDLLHEGHLDVVFQIFLFLKSKWNGVTVLGNTEPEIDQTHFPTEDWSATTYIT